MPGVPETDYDRASLCYATAYFVLPRYVFEEPGRVLDEFDKRPDYAAKFFYVMACRMDDREPHPDDVRRITARSGMLNDDRSFHLVEYPPFPPVDLTAVPEAQVMEAMRKVVLAPYYSAIVYGEGRRIEHYLVLGQSPEGATTLREVTPRLNANLGRGCAPSPAAFVELLRTTLAPGGQLPPAIAGVGRGAPDEPARGQPAPPQPAPKRWWQFWRK